MSVKYLTSAPDRVSDVPTIPKRPERCGVFGCKDFADVVQVVVHDVSRGELSGWWSDFSAGGKSLKQGFTFVAWVPRCPVHYMRDVYAARRGTDSPITGTNPTLTEAAVKDYWRQLDEKSNTGTETTL